MARKKSTTRARSKDTTTSGRAAKDRVLHARIPDQLDEELRTHAQRLGISVSTIVRNVLLHSFDLVEGVVNDTAELARVFRPRRAAAEAVSAEDSAPEDEAVLGWQEAMLNVNAVCDACNAILHKGTRAALGVPVRARPVFICASCLARIEADSDATTHKQPSGDTGARDRFRRKS